MSDDQLFIADELGKLADLRDRGLLSDDEFTVQKAVLLSPLREQVPRNEHPQEQTIGLSAEGTDAMRQWEPRGESLRRTGAAWLLLPASLLVGIGSLLPWLTVNDGISTINRNGFQLGQGEGFSVDGLVALLLGIIVGLIGVTAIARASLPSWIRRSPIVVGLGITVAGANSLTGIVPYIRHLRTQFPGISASVGYGVILVIAGGVVAVLSGLTAWSDRRRERRAEPTRSSDRVD
jgi:hypothetical protein